MNSRITPILVLLLLIVTVFTCEINPNTQQLIDQPMVLLGKTLNGEKYIVGDINSTTKLYVLKVKGTSYEMGKAMGELFKDELPGQVKSVFDYYQEQIKQKQTKAYPKFASKIAKFQISVVKTLLDMNYIITRKYTNARYYQQIKGIANGAGMSEKDIIRLNLLSELIKAKCTVAGLWGPATSNGQILHMRSLDWQKHLPINKIPLAVVYQPSDTKLKANINFAWLGFIGSLTGISQKISIGQKVWLPPKNSVQMTRYGNPWTYVFRDVLYQTSDLKSAINFLNKTHRTCAIHIGIASLQDRSFRMFEYAYKTLNVYDDKNYNHYNANHPQKDGIAFFDKHSQPSNDPCVGSILTNPNYYGKWQAQTFWRMIGLSHQTGDSQHVVFDLDSQIAYVSYSEYGTGNDAYRRNPIKVYLKELFVPF